MKLFLQVIALLLVISCGQRESSKNIDNSERNELQEGTSLSFNSIQNIKDSSIINSTNLKVDVLFNTVSNYLGGKQIDTFLFHTDCMICEPIQEYKDGFLFGKRLHVTQSNTILYEENVDIPDSVGIISDSLYYGKREDLKFKFSEGEGVFEFNEISCNDADLNNVTLNYESGKIVINDILNPRFFEFDLNRDSQKEQFLLGSRNCTQELVVLRIRK